MNLSFNQSLSQTQELRAIPMTESIFENAARLLENTEYQKILTDLAPRKSMRRYRSSMDFLFCELFPQYKYHCRRYYQDKAPSLRLVLSKFEIRFYDQMLYAALIWAERLTKARKLGFKDFRMIVFKNLYDKWEGKEDA